MEVSPGDAGLVEKLTTMLEQAKSGELTSFAAVTLKQKGGADRWGFITRGEDATRVAGELKVLTQEHAEMCEG